jgi:hypothetical protein
MDMSDDQTVYTNIHYIIMKHIISQYPFYIPLYPAVSQYPLYPNIHFISHYIP